MFYEHIGHMQFSTLTLHTYLALLEFTKGEKGFFVSWDKVQNAIENAGFSKRLGFSELDRFCYGFECMDRFIDGKHEIALTNVGLSFLAHLLNEAPIQPSQIAFLVRPSKRKDYWNVIVQETTFFNPEIYKFLAEYKFRSGGARDFIKSIRYDVLLEFLSKVVEKLSVAKQIPNFTVTDCIKQVEEKGKYWASAGGKYSWYVYSQKFELPFDDEDWACYGKVIESLIRPPEWGGGKDVAYSDFLHLVKNEERFIKFRKAGIIRPLWSSDDIKKSKLRITAPGYLMWERKKKGFIFECLVRKTNQQKYSLGICNASDFPSQLISIMGLEHADEIPSYKTEGNTECVLNKISKMLSDQSSFFRSMF